MLDACRPARYGHRCMELSANAKTVDALLRATHDMTLVDILDLRKQGTSYRGIAIQLRGLTDGAVDVTGETIRNWINQLELAS